MTAIVTGSNILVPVTFISSVSYTATIRDHVIVCGVPENGMTITLPNTSDIPSGLVLVIKDDGNATSTNKITISSTNGIDGSSSIEIETGKESITLVSEGSFGWHIIGSYTAPS